MGDESWPVYEALRATLTKRQREVLCLMHEAETDDRFTDAELVYERGRGYVGDQPISPRTFFALIRAGLLRHVDGSPGGFEVYALNSDGRRLARQALAALAEPADG